MQLMPAPHFDTIKVRHIWFTIKCYGKGYQTIFIYLTVSTLQCPLLLQGCMYILVNPSKNFIIFSMEDKAWIIAWKLH